MNKPVIRDGQIIRPMTMPKSRPGKSVVFVGAVTHGENARDFYDHPELHGLVGDDYEDMMNRCARKWGWESGEVLDRAVCQALGQESHWPLSEEVS